jgi:hypothetical protein
MRKRTYIKLFLIFILISLTLFTFSSLQAESTSISFSQINEWLEEAGEKYEIPPIILKAIAWQESNWRHYDKNGNILSSPQGYYGIMQIPNPNLGPKENIFEGARILGVDKWNTSFKGSDKYPNYIEKYDKRKDILENWFYAIVMYGHLKESDKFAYVKTIYSIIENPENYYDYVSEKYKSVDEDILKYFYPRVKITVPFGMKIKDIDGIERIFPNNYDPQHIFGFTIKDLVDNGGTIHDKDGNDITQLFLKEVEGIQEEINEEESSNESEELSQAESGIHSIDIGFSTEDYTWKFKNEGPFVNIVPGINGLCFGMSLTSGLAFLNKIPLPKCNDPYLLPNEWQKAIKDAQMELVAMLKGLKALITSGDHEKILNTLKDTLERGIPCILFLKGDAIHAVLAYGIEGDYDEGKIKVYDPNYPNQISEITYKREVGKIKIDKYTNKEVYDIWEIQKISNIPDKVLDCSKDEGKVEVIGIDAGYKGTPIQGKEYTLKIKVKNSSIYPKWVQINLIGVGKGNRWDNELIEGKKEKEYSFKYKYEEKMITIGITNKYTNTQDNFYFNLNLKTEIKGQIKGEGKVIEGAEISIYGTNKKTKSGKDGRYILSDVPVGKIKLVITKEGYMKQEKEIYIPLKGQVITNIDINLTPQTSNVPQAKSWQRTYGGSKNDGASSIQQTKDGGYIVAGYTKSFGAGGSDVYIIKLDENGNIVWEETYGGRNDDGASSIQQTTDGGYIVAGGTNSYGAGGSDVYIIKLDENGNIVWEKTYGGSKNDGASSIQQTKDGGYIVAGWTRSFGKGDYDVYIIKLDENGDKVWEKTYGKSKDDGANSIQQTTEGGYIVAGWTWSFGKGEDVYIIKLDGNGNKIWEKNYSAEGWDEASSIQQTKDGGYIVAGWTKSFGPNERVVYPIYGIVYWDVYIIKLNVNGNKIWEKIYKGGSFGNLESLYTTTDNWVYSIQQTKDGGYIVAGWTSGYKVKGENVYIIKLDANGNKVWEKKYGGEDYYRAYSIQQTKDGGYIVAGETNSFGEGDYDVYIIKLDENGNLTYSIKEAEESLRYAIHTIQTALENYARDNFGYYPKNLLSILSYLPDNQFPKHPLTNKPYKIGINLFDPENGGSPVKNSSDVKYQYAIVYKYDTFLDEYTLIGYDQTNTKVILIIRGYYIGYDSTNTKIIYIITGGGE